MVKKTQILFVLVATVILVACEPAAPLETKGGISGTVTEAGTNLPIEAAEVNVSGISQSYTTGADGKFSIKDLPEENYTVAVSKEGYSNNKKTITVIAGKTASADFALTKILSTLSVSPTNLDFGAELEKITFDIKNETEGVDMKWEIEKPQSATWIDFSEISGTLKSGVKTVTATLKRHLLTEEKTYTADVIVKSTNGGGAVTLKISAIKKGAVMAVEPSILDFGASESEKTLLISNSFKEGAITYKGKSNESWITLQNNEGTINNADIGTIKVLVSRLNLSPGDHSGTIVVSSNKNSVTVVVKMNVLAKQPPQVSNLQSSDIKYNSINVSAYISSVGSAAVTSSGFCWSTSNSMPTTADNKNNLGGTSSQKSLNSTIAGLNPNTNYYIRAYAVNEEGIAYSNPIQIKTLTPPTMPIVRTLNAESVKHDQASINGSIDNLGDGYVTAYGFCYSTSNPNPTLSDQSVSIGSTTTQGSFSGNIIGLKEQSKYFVRAYATNSMGTAYGGSIQITTPIAPPLVTAGLLAYYTFDNDNCDDYFGEINYSGLMQGTGEELAFVTDIPGSKGKALRGNAGKYYLLTTTPDNAANNATYSVWIKTKVAGGSVYTATNKASHGRAIGFYSNKVYTDGYYSSNGGILMLYDGFSIDLSTVLFDGGWHHLVVVFSNQTASLYVDNRLYQTINSNTTRQSQARIGFGYNGLMDNFRIYNRALSQDEIKEIYNARQ